MKHCVWIAGEDGGFAVRCIPHGEIGWAATHLAAFLMGLEHDFEEGGGCV